MPFGLKADHVVGGSPLAHAELEADEHSAFLGNVLKLRNRTKSQGLRCRTAADTRAFVSASDTLWLFAQLSSSLQYLPAEPE